MLNGSNNVMPSIPLYSRPMMMPGPCWARKPVIEFCIPSLLDDSLAPKGSHVMFCCHLPDGRSWDDAREEAADTIIDTIEEYAPGFRNLIVGRQLNSQLDIEHKLNMVGGDIFHGHCILTSLCQRPVPGSELQNADQGALLGGSGAHPGGGVCGLPGRNCARGHERPLDRYAGTQQYPSGSRINASRNPCSLSVAGCRMVKSASSPARRTAASGSVSNNRNSRPIPRG